MNTSLPKVSFFLPVYNEETRLRVSIQSILSQDYPRDKIEILVVDGGSSDKTKETAETFPCVRIFDNHLKLADYGIKICMPYATGDLFIIFAADNGLAVKDWLKTAVSLFTKEKELSVLWAKMIASETDPPLNRYYALIQNDPLSFFINRNLQSYMQSSKKEYINGYEAHIFSVLPEKPLIWGANGIVYRTRVIKNIISKEGFIADNDVFQIMIESGLNKVAYLPGLNIYHHHVKRISDWVKKWKRNYISHFLTKTKQRNLRWAFVKNFNIKLLLWIIYSGLPVFSLFHSVYLCIRDRTRYWLYHPALSFLQMVTYSYLTIFTPEGRIFLKNKLIKQ